MNNITGTIITLNNEDLIEDCITSLKKICNEIIVVDSLSSDKTREIAKELGAKVFEQEFLGDGPQKKMASTFASNDWVFSLDADERLEDDLIDYINSIDIKKNTFDGYSFRRRNYCGAKWIKAAGFYPDRVTRLYNRKLVNYHPSTSHSYVDAKSTLNLNYHIRHYTYNSYKDWIDRINFYSTQSAKSLHVKGNCEKSGPRTEFYSRVCDVKTGLILNIDKPMV